MFVPFTLRAAQRAMDTACSASHLPPRLGPTLRLTRVPNLSAAISIIQTQILASDTRLLRIAMFGNFHFTPGQLEAAVALLVGLNEPPDDLR